MKAVIMAAGRGRRMGRLTDDCPKCLLQVGVREILLHQLEAAIDHGVEHAVIVTGFLHERVEAFVRNRALPMRVTIVYNPLWATTNVITSFAVALDSVGPAESFLYMHGDTVFDSRMVGMLLGVERGIVLPYDRRRCGEEEMKVQIVDGALMRICKDMPPEAAMGEFPGVALVRGSASQALRQAVNDVLSRANGDQQFMEAAIQTIVETEGPETIGLVDITGLVWEEIDTVDDLLRARQAFAKPSGDGRERTRDARDQG